MTLIPFPPESLDELAWRLFDLAAIVREMATASREHGIADFELNGNKVQAWLASIEAWTQRGAGELETRIIRERGLRRAREMRAEEPRETSKKNTKNRRTKR